MAEKRDVWHLTGPKGSLVKPKRLVKAYKGLAGLKYEAEAVALLIAAGYKALQEQTDETTQ